MENNLMISGCEDSTKYMAGYDSTRRIYTALAPSKADERDYVYKQSKSMVRDRVDLREWGGPVPSQGTIGSCTGHAIANAYEIQMSKFYPDMYTELSPLFVYYHARLFDDMLTNDSGAHIRDGLKAVKRYGICSETCWPYVEEKFDDQPLPMCYVDASRRIISSYERLYTLTDILEILNADKPVLTGIRIYDSFYAVDTNNDVLEIPNYDDYSIGSHAMVLVGYDIGRAQFIAKNSFGTDWGNQGYCWIPFDYIRMEAFENWYFDISVR